jgi:hypothetical protein
MANKEFKVGDGSRTNELSHTPGGSVINIIHSDGRNLVYDKIKKPQAYINTALRDDSVIEIWVDGEKAWPIVELHTVSFPTT